MGFDRTALDFLLALSLDMIVRKYRELRYNGIVFIWIVFHAMGQDIHLLDSESSSMFMSAIGMGAQ